MVWVALCATLGVALIAMAFSGRDWYLLLLIPFFASSGAQTTRRLRNGRPTRS